MASADLSFTKDGLIYRPGHHHEEEEEEADDFLAEKSHRDGGVYASFAYARSSKCSFFPGPPRSPRWDTV